MTSLTSRPLSFSLWGIASFNQELWPQVSTLVPSDLLFLDTLWQVLLQSLRNIIQIPMAMKKVDKKKVVLYLTAVQIFVIVKLMHDSLPAVKQLKLVYRCIITRWQFISKYFNKTKSIFRSDFKLYSSQIIENKIKHARNNSQISHDKYFLN